ncbi:hypothetical protein AAFF_G00041650 [Aldrovandia affinis]|uniref:Uncharacterized protein n=1 Tax=Aldrovandia affinis TaxID=143900 RepID=A0AAD7S2I6_9TELE|nr:hypothetical protein AAFF_G00041650 [Aldrovandia affinis]
MAVLTQQGRSDSSPSPQSFRSLQGLRIRKASLSWLVGQPPSPGPPSGGAPPWPRSRSKQSVVNPSDWLESGELTVASRAPETPLVSCADVQDARVAGG